MSATRSNTLSTTLGKVNRIDEAYDGKVAPPAKPVTYEEKGNAYIAKYISINRKESFREVLINLLGQSIPGFMPVKEISFVNRGYLKIVMPEYTPLDKYILKKDNIDYLQLILDLVYSLENQQRIGIIHRDIKISNAVVDPNGRAYIIDYGLASLYRGRYLGSRNVMSGYYRAPELYTTNSRLESGNLSCGPVPAKKMDRLIEKLDHITMYNHTIDNWGMGWLIIEMLAGRGLHSMSIDLNLMMTLFLDKEKLIKFTSSMVGVKMQQPDVKLLYGLALGLLDTDPHKRHRLTQVADDIVEYCKKENIAVSTDRKWGNQKLIRFDPAEHKYGYRGDATTVECYSKGRMRSFVKKYITANEDQLRIVLKRAIKSCLCTSKEELAAIATVHRMIFDDDYFILDETFFVVFPEGIPKTWYIVFKFIEDILCNRLDLFVK